MELTFTFHAPLPYNDQDHCNETSMVHVSSAMPNGGANLRKRMEGPPSLGVSGFISISFDQILWIP